MSLDIVCILIAIALLCCYHIILYYLSRRDPSYAIHAMQRLIRAQWVEEIRRNKNEILGVQTLRNSIMSATFFGSTAVLLIIGTLTLSVNADRMGGSSYIVRSLSSSDHSLWIFKTLILVVNFVVAFVFFAQAIRLFSHVGVMLGASTAAAPSAVIIRLLDTAAHCHRLGMRAYYVAIPLLLWLFDPLLMLFGTCALLPALYFLDRAPQ